MSGRFESTNIVMVYLLGTVLVAARFGRGPSALAALLSVALFDFLFVPPRFSFAVSDTQYVITFAVMLTTALLISHLAARGKRQASVARQRERRAAELYALSRELVAAAHDRGAREISRPPRARQHRGRSRRVAAGRGRQDPGSDALLRSRIRASRGEPGALPGSGQRSRHRAVGLRSHARKPACTPTRSPARLRCICR